MDALIIAFAVVLLVLWLGTRRKSVSASAAQNSSLSEPRITFSVETAASQTGDHPDTGQVISTPDDGWILNPSSPLPITVFGVDKNTALTLKGYLEETYKHGQRSATSGILPIIARSNLRWRELDDYIGKHKPQYVKRIDELKRSSPEWPSSSEKDKEDLLTTFRQQAVDGLDVQPYCDLEALFELEPTDVTIDDVLINRYGFESLQLYLRCAANLGKVWVVSADNPQRAGFEKFVTLGLARRGTDIPLTAVLEALRLHDLNKMADGLGQKPFGRKAKAIEFLLSLPEISDRISNVVAFRELFQLSPLPSEFSAVNLSQISAGWRYAAEIAELMAHTYVMGGYSARRTQHQEVTDFIKRWELLPADDACPYCKRAAARVYSRGQLPNVPLHIGCRCTITPVITD